MQIIDISWPISNQITTYKNKNDVLIERTKEFSTHGCMESKLSCGVHTGTHVDAPAHFLENGKTIDQINLSQLIGPCQVIDVSHLTEKITANDLISINFQTKIILFKTRNSLQATDGKFDLNFVYLDHSATAFLIEKQLNVVGIDGLGIERNQPDYATHRGLFKNNVLIIEGLRLGQVTAGNYELICLPLLLVSSDGAPARAILIKK